MNPGYSTCPGGVVGNDKTVPVNGVDLCVETFGNPAHPAILLVAGATASMDWWEDEFCERLAAGSRLVIRYDHRDTGRSVSYQPSAGPYTFRDLVADAIGVLDSFDLAGAHLVGISMGAAIAQLAALDHPERVASLTVISTSPGPGDPDLPPMSDRTDDIAASMTNHWLIEGADRWRDRLTDISAPTLVVHGAEDPLFPVGHALAPASEIPDARLLQLEQTGHELPRTAWDIVVPAVLQHTSGGWDVQADRLAAESIAADDPSGWFERLYAAAQHGEVVMPWDRETPNRMLADWAQTRAVTAAGQRALVVGCGLGADAEYIAGLGYDTTAFDIADTAIRIARSRHPQSAVQYFAADLLHPPTDWAQAFDLVVEIYTVQALPDPPRRQAIAEVAQLVAPSGTLIVVAAARDDSAEPVHGPPWPLTRTEIDAFVTDGLTPVRIERLPDPNDPAIHRWRAEFRRA